MEKKGIGLAFNWLFSIIVGGVILFLAIYGASRFIDTSQHGLYTETAASLVSLFDPLETGLASGKAYEIGFKKESKIFFNCNEESNLPFGKQTISFSEKTLGNEYGESGGRITIKDKYIFAEEVVEGKKLYVFSKPFFMGFKVADVVVVLSENYCFYDASEEVQESLEGLNLVNVIFPNSSEECEGINVCFDSRGDCDIKVYEKQGYVLKEGTKMYYVGNLVYGAIFSSPDIYECNVQRLKAKFDELVKIYLSKIDIIKRKNCESQVGPKLSSVIGTIRNSGDLIGLYNMVDEIDSINKLARSGCRLYYD